MTSPEREEIKACPFCGGTASVIPDERSEYGRPIPPYHAGCPLPKGCGVLFTGDDAEEAITRWNTRKEGKKS